ncbi:MAG: ATP-binding cassette domain-containing protein [Mycobacterium sp.]|nr:ATP-binding cassette domain-containing protein [Mycobacterium sp.]
MADELSAESSAAIEAAVRVLSTSGPDLITAPAYADPTLDAMSVLAAELKSPLLPSNPAVEHRGDPVRDHATASGWLGWQVRLTGTWVDRVALPTLLTRRGKPAALLPRAGKPVLVDGSSRTTRPLDRAAAADVDPDAWVFAEDAPATGGWIALVRWSLRRQGRDLVGIVSLAIVGGLTALLLPVATSAIFRWAIPNGNFTLAVAMLIGFAIVSVGAAILAMSRGRLIIRVRDRMDVVLAHGVLARLLRLRAPFFRTQGVGDTANRALSVAAARAQVSDTAIAAVVLSFFGLTSLGYLFTAGPVLGLVTTLIVFGVLAVSVSIQWRARRILSELLEGRSQTDATVLSLLSSAVSWRVAAAESRAFRLWARRQNVSTTVLRRRLTAVSGAAVVDVAGPTIVLAAFTALVVFVPNGDLTPGSPTAPGAFLALYAAVIQVAVAMLALAANLLALSEYGPVLRRLGPILTAPVEGATQGTHPGLLSGRVTVNRVTFGYVDGGSPLFSDLSLDVAPGEFVACVGPSGSGKSTLLRLLLGFEDPWTGFVSYDGHALGSLDATAVRRQLGVVLQSSQPLGRTIRECVVGDRRVTDDRVWDLLDEASLADDVRAMPLRLETLVGEHGAALSGGQRQRLMVAAALAAEPAIMMFDEATSALDNVSQSVVMRSVLSSPATRIVIAHRLSTVQRADRVVVLADGRIVEEGAPDELLRANGRFAHLAARQMI